MKDHAYLREDLSNLSGHYKNLAFCKCTFNTLNDLTLENCDLLGSKFTTERIEDMLNFTVTLNCFSFNNVELSPLIFDMILLLLCKTSGNTEKRKQLLDLIGRDRAHELLSQMKNLER